MNKQISIVVPVLNEEVYIGKLLEHLLANSSSQNISEIIVVDGGSKDNTQDIVKAFSKFNRDPIKEAYHYIDNSVSQKSLSKGQILKTKIKLITSKKGRAKQMNLGAKFSKGGILYFLHADSFPPKSFDKLIINEIEKGNQAGCFRMQFNSNNLWLKLSGWLTQLPFKFCRGGDQSLYITQSLFNNIGGFDENFAIYEDNDFISKLFKLNQFIVIQKWLITSPRCYQKNGVLKLQYHYWTIHLKKFFGASPGELNQYYKKYIAS
jgi:rSAM/selenodomain-associated transferase 2